MRKLLKPLLIATTVFAAAATSIATAQQVNYEWMRSIQLNPGLTQAFATPGTTVSFVNDNVVRMFRVMNQAVCVDSRTVPNQRNCVVDLCDLNLHDNSPVYHGKTYVGTATIDPDVSLHYTESLNGKTGMNVTEVKTLSLNQGY